MQRTLPFIDQETASRLERVVDEMYDHVELGMDPNAALRKVATDHNLTPEYIRVVGRAYNSGLTNYHIHGTRNLDLVNSATICSPEAVVDELYRKPAKKAEDKFVDPFYLRSPKDHGIATEPVRFTPPKVASERSESSKVNEIMALWRHERARRDALDTERRMVNEKVENCLDKLAEYYRSAHAVDPDEVFANCDVVKVPVRAIFKQAGIERRGPYVRNVPFSWNRMPYSLINETYYWLNKFADLDSRFRKIDAVLQDIEKVLHKRTEPRHHRMSYSTVSKDNDDDKDDGTGGDKNGNLHKSAAEKKPSKLVTTARTLAREAVDVPITKLTKGVEKLIDIPSWIGYKEEKQREESDTSLNEALQPVYKANANDVKVLLTDLMLNDPIISNEDPQEVLRAFKRLAQLAPQVVTKGELLRVVLRRMLAGQLEPLEAEHLLRLNRMIVDSKLDEPVYVSKSS